MQHSRRDLLAHTASAVLTSPALLALQQGVAQAKDFETLPSGLQVLDLRCVTALPASYSQPPTHRLQAQVLRITRNHPHVNARGACTCS